MADELIQTNERISIRSLEEYLASIFNADVEVTQLRDLTRPEFNRPDNGEFSDFVFGTPQLAEIRIRKIPDQIVIHTLREDKFGHEHRSDRARRILLDYDTFNKLPQHAPSLGIGAFTRTGNLLSLNQADEFFLITRYAPGRLYAEDLKNLTQDENLLPDDKNRTLALADYLVSIHSQTSAETTLYPRAIRDFLGHGEGVFGVIDSYPSDFALAPPSRLKAIELRLIDWRWLIKEKADRLSQVHGDFHPWNILFQKDNRFTVLDRSRGEWGEPADDVSALSIHYILFALKQTGFFRGPFKVLFELFWESYLQKTQDVGMLAVVQPFFAWRALALAHPQRTPNLDPEVRAALLSFCENVLEQPLFDPKLASSYLP